MYVPGMKSTGARRKGRYTNEAISSDNRTVSVEIVHDIGPEGALEIKERGGQ